MRSHHELGTFAYLRALNWFGACDAAPRRAGRRCTPEAVEYVSGPGFLRSEAELVAPADAARLHWIWPQAASP
jgi:hypothetical protein